MSLPLSAGLLFFGVSFRQSRLLNPIRRRSSRQNSSKPTLVKFLKCIRMTAAGRILSQNMGYDEGTRSGYEVSTDSLREFAKAWNLKIEGVRIPGCYGFIVEHDGRLWCWTHYRTPDCGHTFLRIQNGYDE